MRKKHHSQMKREEVRDVPFSMRINQIQNDYLLAVKQIIRENLRIKVSKAWITLQLMDHGKAGFEKQNDISCKKKE